MAVETRRLMRQLEGAVRRETDSSPKIAVVIPCYRERDHILDVLKQMPQEIERVYCVDDACPDATGKFVQDNNDDLRVVVLFSARNGGVGAATKLGFSVALEDGMDVVVKLDGDGQMDPNLIPQLVAPILDGRADYTKGNRFFSLENIATMPQHRILGNVAMSFVSKFSSGYWQVFDPANGFLAIHRSSLTLLPLKKISDDYFFESDMLFRLNTLRAVVIDVPMTARYGDEASHFNILKSLPTFIAKHSSNFLRRIFYSYFLRNFSVASIEWILGPLLFGFGFFFGAYHWIAADISGAPATAGTVMLAALPTIIGLQFILAAIDYDVRALPSVPLQSLIFKGAKNATAESA